MACAVSREVLSETHAVGSSAVLCTDLFCNYSSCVGGPPAHAGQTYACSRKCYAMHTCIEGKTRPP